MAQQFSIGEMAKVGNCKVQTIRYYEEIGMLLKPGRTVGNQRVYTQAHRDRLNFIRHSRELGFSLAQIRTILALNDDPSHCCAEVDKIARAHLSEVESKIARLDDMRTELQRMIGACAGGQVSDCRIIEALSDHSLCLSDEHQK
ncbi:MAG: helix-turn-helix domain-containing protein [Amphritea sp.]|jgi:Cu(I)-responsive transcriptional regulator|nr:helix-turn-helix domain-containing protein [Amphritea sp.]